jgi:hypothetical protein
LVERSICNADVPSSNLGAGTKIFNRSKRSLPVLM